MARRCGVSPCALAGFAHSSGDAVVYMDADLQDPPELIPQLIQEWRKGCDVVNTTRLVRLGETRTKMFMTKLGYRLIAIALRHRHSDEYGRLQALVPPRRQ